MVSLKKFTAFLLAVIMIFSLCGFTAMADTATGAPEEDSQLENAGEVVQEEHSATEGDDSEQPECAVNGEDEEPTAEMPAVEDEEPVGETPSGELEAKPAGDAELLSDEEATPELSYITLQKTVGDATVLVTGNLPTDIELVVEQVPAEDVQSDIDSVNGGEVLYAFDITLMLDGQEYTIDESVTVTILGIDLSEAEDVAVYHIPDEAPVEIAALKSQTDTGVMLTADGFSIYALVGGVRSPSRYYMKTGETVTLTNCKGNDVTDVVAGTWEIENNSPDVEITSIKTNIPTITVKANASGKTNANVNIKCRYTKDNGTQGTNTFQITVNASGSWSYNYYLCQEYMGNSSSGGLFEDPLGYGFQSRTTRLTIIDDNGIGWTYEWSNAVRGDWRINGSFVSEATAKKQPVFSSGTIYSGTCGADTYYFTLDNIGWSGIDEGKREVNSYYYLRFVTDYTVNVYLESPSGTLFDGKYYTADGSPREGSFTFYYPDGGIIKDSECEDTGLYSLPTQLLAQDYVTSQLHGYQLYKATNTVGATVDGITVSLFGGNVLNVYCTLYNYTVEYKWADGIDSDVTVAATLPTDSGSYTVLSAPTASTDAIDDVSADGGTYSFDGWGTAVRDDVNHKYVFTGSWTYTKAPDPTYTVSYDANGGNTAHLPADHTGLAAGASQTLEAGTGMTKDSDADYTYAFDGWSTTSGTDNSSGKVTSVTIDGTTPANITVYAIWTKTEIPKYSLTTIYTTNGVEDGRSSQTNLSTAPADPGTGDVTYSGETYAYSSFTHSGNDYTLTYVREAYTVAYSWTGNVPTGVTLPSDDSDYETETDALAAVDKVYTSSTEVFSSTGKYEFSGWLEDVDDDLTYVATFTGSWTYTAATESNDTASFTVEKQDETGASLKGATFTLTNSSGAVVAEKTTTDNGDYTDIVFDGLTAGTYTLTETAPTGYDGAGPWTVTVSTDGTPVISGPSREDGNIIHKAWNWIVSAVTGESNENLLDSNNVLTVTNSLKTYTVDYQFVTTGVTGAVAAPSGVTVPTDDTDITHGTTTYTVKSYTGTPSAGYTFHGWYTNDACTSAVVSPATITGATTYYGYWTRSAATVVNHYYVVYNSGAGTGSDVINDNGGSYYTVDAAPATIDFPSDWSAPTHKHFIDWDPSSVSFSGATENTSKQTYNDATNTTDKYYYVTLTAQYSSDTSYTVKYLDDDGSTLGTVFTLYTGDLIPECSTGEPSKAADNEYKYKFDKWTLTGTEGADHKVGTTDLVYTATYKATAKEYKVNVNINYRTLKNPSTYSTAGTATYTMKYSEISSFLDGKFGADVTVSGVTFTDRGSLNGGSSSFYIKNPSYIGIVYGGYEYGLEGKNGTLTLENLQKALIAEGADKTVTLNYYFAQTVHYSVDNGYASDCDDVDDVTQIFSTGTGKSVTIYKTLTDSSDLYTHTGWTFNGNPLSDATPGVTSDATAYVIKLNGFSQANASMAETKTVNGVKAVDGTTVDGVIQLWFNFVSIWETNTGSLTITKALNSDAPSSAYTKEYSFTVTGPGGYDKIFTVTGEGSKTIDKLFPGEYIVTENDAGISGYVLNTAYSTTDGKAAVTKGGASEVTVTNSYAAIVYPIATYTLTVNWLDDEGNVLRPQETTYNITSGSDYAAVQHAFEGYTFSRMADGSDAASGKMTGNKTVTFIYAKTAPTNPEGDITDPTTPPSPEVPANPEGDITIVDDDVPTSDSPQTGDSNNPFLLLAIMAGCVFGIVGVAVIGRKKRSNG